MKVFFYPKTIKIYNLITFPCIKVSIFHTFFLITKNASQDADSFGTKYKEKYSCVITRSDLEQ